MLMQVPSLQLEFTLNDESFIGAFQQIQSFFDHGHLEVLVKNDKQNLCFRYDPVLDLITTKMES